MTTQTPGAGGDLLEPDEVASELGVSRWTVDRLRRAQEIEAVKVGGQFRYRRAAVDDYLNRNTIPAAPVGRTSRSRSRGKRRAA
jgi:excisionase family DNA binding protein